MIDVVAPLLAVVAVSGAANPALAAPSAAGRSIAVALVPIVPEGISVGEMTWAREEAMRLWAPYGVELVWLERKSECERPPFPFACLFVVLSTKPLASPGGVEPASLGQVDFSLDGEPLPEIRIWYEAVVTLVARWNRRFGLDAPKRLREKVVGRALGRVIAHEVGHILMGTKTHSASGLMRPSFRAQDLSSLSSRGFTLSTLETAAIDARLASREALIALSPDATKRSAVAR